MTRATHCVSLCACLAATGCSSHTETPGPGLGSVLPVIADEVVIPTYADLVSRASGLEDATAVLCASPSTSALQSARDAWRAVREPLKYAEGFSFGPMMDLRVDGALDFWPLREDSLAEALASTEPVTDELIASASSASKGLPVIEYLLFAAESDDATLANLAAGSTLGRNCAYLAALGRDVHRQATVVYEAWCPDAGNFRDELAKAGRGSEAYPKVQNAVSAVINELIAIAQQMEGMKLATPLGKRDGGQPQPEDVEAPFADHGIEDLVANLDGVRGVYSGSRNGRSRASFTQAMNERQPELNRAILDKIDDCRNADLAIPRPLSQAVVSSPAAVEGAFVCHKQLLRLLQADLAGTLGVTPTFNDSDGD